VTANAKGTATITATLNSKAGSYGLTVIAGLTSIDVTPAGPGLTTMVPYNTQQFVATAHYTDGTMQDISSMATTGWSTFPTGFAMVNNVGLVTANAAGGTSVLVTSPGPAGQVTGSTAVDIVTGPPVNLSGDYTFTLTAADTRGPAYFAGQFDIPTAGTTGSFTGVEDCNSLATGVVNAVALSGSYTTWPDGRGILTFGSNTCHPSGVIFRFALAASGGVQWQKGRLAQFDGNGTTEGTIEAQNSADFSVAALDHTYTFKLAGIDSGNYSQCATPPCTPSPLGEVGTLQLGSGTTIGGFVDANDFQDIFANDTFNPSGTYTVNATTGRGTLTVSSTLGNGLGTGNYAFYIVDQNHLNLIELETAGIPSLAGRAETQATGVTWANNSFGGGYAFQVGRPVIVNGNLGDRTEFGSVGQYTFTSGSTCTVGSITGGAAMTGVRDDANIPTGVTNPISDIGGCYGVTATGRTNFLVISNSENTYRQYVMYPVTVNSSNVATKFYFLGTYDGNANQNPPATSKNAPIGEADLQTGTFSAASLNGPYSLSASELTSSYSEGLLQLTFDGAGESNGLIDFSTCVTGPPCAISSTLVTNANYLATPPVGSERGAIELPASLGFADFVFYLVDDTSAFILGTNTSQAASLGVLGQQ
jgi:hypothetical protein